jgi:SAM-dependent methyltransferase
MNQAPGAPSRSRSRALQAFQADLTRRLDFLEAQSFDIVAASLVMHYLDEWVPTLREFHRILRPEGHLVFSTHHPFMDFTVFGRPDYFARELLHDPWERRGQSFDVYFYRRPLREIVQAVLDAPDGTATPGGSRCEISGGLREALDAPVVSTRTRKPKVCCAGRSLTRSPASRT